MKIGRYGSDPCRVFARLPQTLPQARRRNERQLALTSEARRQKLEAAMQDFENGRIRDH